MTLRVLNNSKDDFSWKNYNVYIELEDGTLFYNYKTKAEDGLYANFYTVAAGKAHDQSVCFGQKFEYRDIKKVWLSWVDEKFFSLVYQKGK